MTVYDDARKFQLDAENLQQQNIRILLDEYRAAMPSIVRRAEESAREIAELRASGATIGEARQLAAAQAQMVARALREEIDKMTIKLLNAIAAGEHQAVVKGLSDAQSLVQQGLPGVAISWSAPQFSGVTRAIGALRGKTLATILHMLSEESQLAVRRAITTGLIAGQSPRVVARDIARRTELPASKADMIARTEMLRAYREAIRQSYEENSNIVRGYRRLASKSVRTCVMCLALDGMESPSNSIMATHPMDRCTMVPIVDRARFGLKPLSTPETGAEWFDRQPEEIQWRVLGTAGLDKYTKGATLSDFTRVRESRTWGPSLQRVRLSEV